MAKSATNQIDRRIADKFPKRFTSILRTEHAEAARPNETQGGLEHVIVVIHDKNVRDATINPAAACFTANRSRDLAKGDAIT